MKHLINKIKSICINEIASLPAGRQGLFVLLAMTLTGTPVFADSLTIDEAVSRALQNNPGIQAAGEETKAAKARIPQAYTPENPEIGIMFDRTPINTLNVEDAMQTNYRVKQNIPFPGKLVSAGKAAKNEARAASGMEGQSKLMISAEVKKTFFDILFIDKKIETEKRNQNLFRRYTGVAETKYSSGQSNFSDPLRAGIEAADLESQISELEQERTSLFANLSYLLGETVKDDTSLTVPPNPDFNYTLADLKDIAAKNQPELRSYAFMKSATKNKVALAKQQYVPDLMTELEYNQVKDGQNGWTASFGISVPLWFFGRQQPAIHEAKAMQSVATKTYENALNKLVYSITSTFEQIKSSERIGNIYKKTILPKASAALKSEEANYIVGKTDFLSLADSARKLREYQIDYWQARTNFEKAVAEMELLIGGMVSK